MTNAEYPFAENKIPIARGLDEYRQFVAEYPDFAYCPYVANKDEEGWAASTSRIYMNRILRKFLYIPVNIAKDDTAELRAAFDDFASDSRVVAVNITQPHKSSPVLRELFLGNINSKKFVDTMIRNEKGRLQAYDLNAPAFVAWYNDEIGSFERQTVILNGVGGVGEAIAHRIAGQKPEYLLLVDPAPKTAVTTDLHEKYGVQVTYYSSLQEAPPLASDRLVVINAAGKEGAADNSALRKLFEERSKGGIFVDIRPQLTIDIVDKAKDYGWRAYTGHGMNARNDYALLQGIAQQLPDATVPTFQDFQTLVASAS